MTRSLRGRNAEIRPCCATSRTTGANLEAMNATTSTRWTLDPGHSSVGFSVRHLMIYTLDHVYWYRRGVPMTVPVTLVCADSATTANHTATGEQPSGPLLAVARPGNFEQREPMATELAQVAVGAFTVNRARPPRRCDAARRRADAARRRSRVQARGRGRFFTSPSTSILPIMVHELAHQWFELPPELRTQGVLRH
jgi:hypothetical protein